MRLDPRRVLKHFGQYPERGKALPCLPKKRVTVGWRQKPFGRGMEPDDDVMVTRRVALKHIQGDTWHVLCDEPYWPIVQRWLNFNCGVALKPKKEKRRRRRQPNRERVAEYQTNLGGIGPSSRINSYRHK